jgi:hypothetical protein
MAAFICANELSETKRINKQLPFGPGSCFIWSKTNGCAAHLAGRLHRTLHLDQLDTGALEDVYGG